MLESFSRVPENETEWCFRLSDVDKNLFGAFGLLESRIREI